MNFNNFWGALILIGLGVFLFNYFGLGTITADNSIEYTSVTTNTDYSTLTYSAPRLYDNQPEYLSENNVYYGGYGTKNEFEPTAIYEAGGQRDVEKWYFKQNGLDPAQFTFQNSRIISVSVFAKDKTTDAKLNSIGYSLFNGIGCETGTNTNVYTPCYEGQFKDSLMQDFAAQMSCEVSGTMNGGSFTHLGEVSWNGKQSGFNCKISNFKTGIVSNVKTSFSKSQTPNTQQNTISDVPSASTSGGTSNAQIQDNRSFIEKIIDSIVGWFREYVF